MTLTENTVVWMFFAIVALAALAIVTNYFVVKLVMTGRAAVLERKGSGNVTYIDRGVTRESER